LNKVLVNEAFINTYKLESPLGATFNKKYEIIGVIKDFHFKSKNYAIGPLVIKNRPYASYCLAQIKTDNFNSLHYTIDRIKSISSELSPDFPVEISFLDVAVEHMYASEIQFRRTFAFFAGCAIFLSCLGILALSLLSGQQRTKEIGIRKVNGAHVEDILMLLNKDFIKWVMFACIIATPIAYFFMNLWLEGFAYKTEISWWIFLAGGGIALLIALLTISWQSWSASKRNPVDALRYE
jgi:putative ABC transport system permease protein